MKKTFHKSSRILWASLVAKTVKNLPAMQETWVQSLGWEDLLEKGMTTHSSILAWRIPWTEVPGMLQSMGSHTTEQLTHTHTHQDILGFPDGSDGKESACNVEDLGLIPGSGRFPGEGNGHGWSPSLLKRGQDETLFTQVRLNVSYIQRRLLVKYLDRLLSENEKC